MNDYYPLIIISIVIATIILWVCVRSIQKTWRSTRNNKDALSIKLEAILTEALSKQGQQQSHGSGSSDEPETDQVSDNNTPDAEKTENSG